MSSCSQYINTLQKDEFEIIKNADTPLLNYCPLDSQSEISVVGKNESSINDFSDFLNSKKGQNLPFIEKAILWSLYQISIRPDQSSPAARFQAAIYLDKKIYYYDFYNEETGTSMPFLGGLKDLLHKFKRAPSTLMNLAKIADSNLPQKVTIGGELAQFLEEQKTLLMNNPIFKKSFLKSDETIKKGERLPLINYEKLIRSYLKENLPAPSLNTYLFTNDVLQKNANNSLVEYNCNHDFTLYKNHLFTLQGKRPLSNAFGLRDSKGNFFFGMTSLIPKSQKNLYNLALFDGVPNVLPGVFCYHQKTDSDLTAFFSIKGVDPGQVLYHYLKNENSPLSGIEQLAISLEGPRKIILNNPLRILYEGHRADENDLEKILKNKNPLYYVQGLGEIWAYINLNNEKGFIKDGRENGFLSCRPTLQDKRISN